MDGMRDDIIKAIRRLAAENKGQAPGQKAFARDTGVAEHIWRGKYWARWGDALIEAGFQPNQWTERLDSDAVLTGIIAACRHYGRVPTRDEIAIFRKTEPSIPSEQAIKSHFGRRADLLVALAKRAADQDAYADIKAMLPENPQPSPEPQIASSKVREGFVYLIKSGDFYKVGRSDDLERRVKEIRIALPDKAELVHSIRTDDPPGIEAYWHRRFADRRANGEWFKLPLSDVAAFKKRTFQ
jgi:hypothetical protein